MGFLLRVFPSVMGKRVWGTFQICIVLRGKRSVVHCFSLFVQWVASGGVKEWGGTLFPKVV